MIELNPYKLPNNFRRNDLAYKISYLKEYTHFFYLNSDDTFDDADFNDWVMGLFDRSGNEVQIFSNLQQDIITGSEFRVYTEFTIEDTIDKGEYFFAIYNSNTDDVKYQSNCFNVIDSEDVENLVFLEFRNSSNVFNFNFEVVDNYNTLFIDLNEVEAQPEFELNQYQERSTGITRNEKSQARKVIVMESYYFDDGANEGMLMLTMMDDQKLNEKVVEVKEGYQIENNRRNNLQKGTISYYDQSVSVINLNG